MPMPMPMFMFAMFMPMPIFAMNGSEPGPDEVEANEEAREG